MRWVIKRLGLEFVLLIVVFLLKGRLWLRVQWVFPLISILQVSGFGISCEVMCIMRPASVRCRWKIQVRGVAVWFT